MSFFLPGLAAMTLPAIAFAQTIFQAVGVFNLFVGFMVTAAVLVFAAGFTYYLAWLGLHGRITGIYIMEWSIAILFVLIVLLTIERFIRLHTETMIALASFVLLVLVIVVFVKVTASGGKKGKKEER